MHMHHSLYMSSTTLHTLTLIDKFIKFDGWLIMIKEEEEEEQNEEEEEEEEKITPYHPIKYYAK